MNLKLSTGTKKAFVDIDSSMGFTNIPKLFKRFMKNTGPLPMNDFADLLGTDVDTALKLAQKKGEINEQGELVGLLGLSVVPTNIALTIAGKKFYTWCAADSLIFPALLQENAEIHSHDPINNESIEIKINNDRLIEITPDTAMISWIDDVNEDDIRCSMCNRVHFFATPETANTWHKNNKDARVLSVTEYYASGIISTDGS